MICIVMCFLLQKVEGLVSIFVFGLAFVVEVVVGYNPIMHKTQPQKLIFLAFCSFLVGPIPKPQSLSKQSNLYEE
jgi:hypothetical protein